MQYENYRCLAPEKYPEALKELYLKRTGQHLDLDNPKIYAEKVQWLKLYDSTPLKARLADKYLVKDWVKEKIGEKYVVPLLGVWDSFDEIDFAALPQSFVLKTNHACQSNVVVRDKAMLNIAAAKHNFDNWMQKNYALPGLELHYAYIEPKIIAEAYLENDGEELGEYKIFCFGGKAEYIRYCRYPNGELVSAFYDTEWNKQPFESIKLKTKLENDPPKPENLGEAIALAETLAAGFAHVRVDFYILKSGEIKFGEMTFTSGAGFIIFDPPEWNLVLGEKLILPPKQVLPEKSLAERGVQPCPSFAVKETNYKKIAVLYDELTVEHKKSQAELKGRLQLAWDRNAELKEKLQTSSNANAQLKEKLQTSSNTNAQLKEKLQTSSNTNVQLKEKLQTSSSTNAELKERLQLAWDRNTELKERLQLSWDRNAELKEKLQTAWDTNAQHKENLGKMKETVAAKNEKINVLRGQRAELREKLQALQNRNTGLNENLEETKKTVAAKNEKINVLRGQRAELREKLQVQKSKNKDKSEKIKKLRCKVNKQAEKYKSLEKQYNELAEKYKKLEKRSIICAIKKLFKK